MTGLLAYSNSFGVPFHYDDIHFLREQILIKSFPLFLDWITHNVSVIITSRAFLLFTFYINYLISGLDTFGYHIVNVLIHISTAFLFYLLLSSYVDNEQDGSYHITAILASTLFLLHPIATESVTYISSRSSGLSAFFILASMLLFFKATRNTFHIIAYLLSIACFVLGLATKEAAVVTPVLMFLFDVYFVSDTKKISTSRIAYYLPFLGILGVGFSYYVATFITHPTLQGRGWTVHILTELKVFVAYLRLLILPYGQNIDPDVRESLNLDPAAMVSLVIIAGLIVVAVLARNKKKVLSFSILWFFINLSPFLVVRLSDYMAERWVYAASLGFSLALSDALTALLARYRKIGVSLIIFMLLLYGTLTLMRNSVYQDPIRLWTDAAEKSPGKIRPESNLCASYLERMNIDKAIEWCDSAVKKGSDYQETYINLASAYVSKGELEKAKKILLSMNAGGAAYIYHYNLGVIYSEQGEYSQAIKEYRIILKEMPRSPAILSSIGECYRYLKNTSKADEYFLLATRGIPQNGEDYLMLAESYFSLGNNEKGTENLRNALVAEPLNLHIRKTIANTYLDKKMYDEAYRHFSIMAKIAPNLPLAYTGMGKSMLAKGDRKEARKQFVRALNLLPTDTKERNDVLRLLEKAGG
jgi:tetratricopeptide (TPR) repeat protein